MIILRNKKMEFFNFMWWGKKSYIVYYKYRHYPFFWQKSGTESGSFSSLIGRKYGDSADKLPKYRIPY